MLGSSAASMYHLFMEIDRLKARVDELLAENSRLALEKQALVVQLAERRVANAEATGAGPVKCSKPA